MDFAGIGSLLGGLGQAAGGIAGLFGGGSNNTAANLSYMNAQQDRAFQMAAMENGIKWRVRDAEQAGIHPLYALGAPVFSPSPTSVQNVDPSPNLTPKYLSDMGQGLERAIRSTQTPQERVQDAANRILQQQQITRGELGNELLKTQIASERARLQRDQVGPPGPAISGPVTMPGQVDSPFGVYKKDPPEVLNQLPGTRTAEAGVPSPDTRWLATPSGVRPSPSKGAGVQDTDIFNPEYLEWAWRNKVFPNASRAPSPEYMAKVFPGAIGARWNQMEFEWQPVYRKKVPMYFDAR